MDDYGEGACGVAAESLVRGRTQREPAAVEKDYFHGDRHGGAFLTSSPVSIKTPRYTDYSPATPAPHPMSLGPFPCPAQLPQTAWGRALEEQEGGGLHASETVFGVAGVTGVCLGSVSYRWIGRYEFQ
ncbi:unnamed protein product [Boreogadus saida]